MFVPRTSLEVETHRVLCSIKDEKKFLEHKLVVQATLAAQEKRFRQLREFPKIFQKAWEVVETGKIADALALETGFAATVKPNQDFFRNLDGKLELQMPAWVYKDVTFDQIGQIGWPVHNKFASQESRLKSFFLNPLRRRSLWV